MLQKLQRLTRSGVAQTMGLALILAVGITGTAVTHALDMSQTHTFTIKIYDGDPAQNKTVSGINALLVADDRTNPSHGLSGTSDANGTIVFTNVHEGGFNVEIAHNISQYQGRDYHVIIDADTTLEASLISNTANIKKYDLTVKVYNGDPAQNKLVPNIRVDVWADNSSSPTKDSTGTTNGLGTANFQLAGGGYTVHLAQGSTAYYVREYHVNMDADTTLEASLISQTPATNPTTSPDGSCLPTPPRGQPLLNIWPISESGAPCTDYSMLAAKNSTTGGSYVTGNGTVNATDGQIITVELYIHNGVIDYPDNIAHNVQVSASIPNSSGTISAKAWADNADLINSATKGGNVNVSLGSNQVLQYVSGSTKLYDNTGAFQANLPDGITGSGVSIGDMRGCFQFLHFVTFQLQVKTNTPAPTPAAPVLTISKTVSNVTKNIGYQKSVSADVNDTVSFKITVTNTGKGDATHVVVKDVLPAGLTKIDNIDLSNIAMLTIASGQSKTVTFSTKVNSIACGSTITNTASAQSNEVGPVTDSAKITGPVCQTPPPPPVVVNSYTFAKQVRNVTSNSTFAKTVAAHEGDKVEFKLTVSATSGTVNNIVINDALPTGLTYVNGTLKVKNNTSTDPINRINIGNLTSGQTADVLFQATVNNLATGVTNKVLTNTATATTNIGSKTDSASVTVTKVVNPTSTLNIDKTVANVTTNSGYQNNVSVKTNDTVDFRIIVTNTGSIAAKNVIISDVLPQGITYADNLYVSMSAAGSNPVVSPYLKIATLNPGQTVSVFFYGKIASTSCNTSLINTASAVADNASSVNDTATVNMPSCGGSTGGTPNLVLSKTAWNDTKNKDATKVTASANDEITYILKVQNTGNAPVNNYVFSDDISDVLQLATAFDIGSTGKITNGVLTYTATTIPAGGTVTRAFRVKVKNPIPTGTDYVIVNTFGNTVKVVVTHPFVAPPTGITATLSIVFAGLMVLVFGLYRSGAFSKLTGLVKS